MTGLENINTQQARILESESALMTGLTQLKDKTEEKETKRVVTQQETISTLLEPGNDAGRAMLKNLITKAAIAGVDILKRDKGDQETLDEATQMKDDDTKPMQQDMAAISTKFKQTSENDLVSRIKTAISFESLGETGAKPLVQQYISATLEYLLDPKGSKTDKLKKIEIELKAKGVSDEKIFTISKAVRVAVRADITLKIKETMLFRELSGNKLESTMSDMAVKDVIDNAFFNEKLGGWNFGNYMENLQGATDTAKESATKEMSEFALEELENKMIGKLISKDEETKDVQQLLDLAKKTTTNVSFWARVIWAQKKEDLGLNLIIVPPQTTGKLVDTNTGDNKRKNQQPEEIAMADEGSPEMILMNRLRAIYMQRYMKGKNNFDFVTSFKVRRLKNGLMKMGIFTPVLDEKLSMEAETLAKQKIVEMLNEVCLERASLYTLKGSANNAIKRKRRGLLKSARRLGMGLSSQDMAKMQYLADKRILDVIKEQISIGEGFMKSPYANRSIQNMLKSLKTTAGRLTSETNDIEMQYRDVRGSEIA